MAVVVVGRRCLRSRVVVSVVVVVRVVTGMIMFMVMRVAVRSHIRPSRLTDMEALVGRVFAVLDLRRVICGLQGCLAIVVQNATLDAVGSAANATSSPSSFVSYHQCQCRQSDRQHYGPHICRPAQCFECRPRTCLVKMRQVQPWKAPCPLAAAAVPVATPSPYPLRSPS